MSTRHLKFDRDRPMDLDSRKQGLSHLRPAAFLLMTIFSLCCFSTTTADPDLWGYLAFGRLFWGQGQFPYVDVFAYVPTLKPWIYHEWLTGVLFYPVYQSLGTAGLQVLKYAVGLATAGIVYLTARRRGADLWPTAVILLLALFSLSTGYSAVRAQVFTYFFFTVLLFLLESARLSGNRHWLWLMVPIQVVWANLHGGFLAGLGLIGLYVVGEALSRRDFRPYLGWFLLAGLATLINPYGLKYWSYLAQAVTMPRPEITEWASFLEGYKQGYLGGVELFYFLDLIAVALLLAWWTHWREIAPALVLLFTIYLAISHSRHQVFLALSFGAYMPLLLTAYFRELATRPGVKALLGRLEWKIPALALTCLIGFFSVKLVCRHPLELIVAPEPKGVSKTEIYYPLGAIDYLEKHHLAGKLLVFFNWGEYCLWRLYPQCLVAIDGRYETVYPENLCKEYFAFMGGREGWRDFLEHYPPDLILIELRSRVYGLLSGNPEWRQVYADPGGVLFRRQGQDAAANLHLP